MLLTAVGIAAVLQTLTCHRSPGSGMLNFWEQVLLREEVF